MALYGIRLEESPQDAVEKAGHGGYALILMEMHMTVMNDLKATHVIRQLPGMPALPIPALPATTCD
jgi:CheY-like chemotaxis protein